MPDEGKQNIHESVMDRIKNGEAKMRPRWEFVVGSIALASAFFGLIGAASFLISLMAFSLRSHGPMGTYRFSQLVGTFPWWALAVSALGMMAGIYLLRRYDFSYKKNFPAIAAVLVLAVLGLGILVNLSGVDGAWKRRGHIDRFYRRYDGGRGPNRMPPPGMMQFGRPGVNLR